VSPKVAPVPSVHGDILKAPTTVLDIAGAGSQDLSRESSLTKALASASSPEQVQKPTRRKMPMGPEPEHTLETGTMLETSHRPNGFRGAAAPANAGHVEGRGLGVGLSNLPRACTATLRHQSSAHEQRNCHEADCTCRESHGAPPAPHGPSLRNHDSTPCSKSVTEGPESQLSPIDSLQKLKSQGDVFGHSFPGREGGRREPGYAPRRGSTAAFGPLSPAFTSFHRCLRFSEPPA